MICVLIGVIGAIKHCCSYFDTFLVAGLSEIFHPQVFAVILNADVVQIHLLDAQVPGWGVFGEYVPVSGGVLKQWILPT